LAGNEKWGGRGKVAIDRNSNRDATKMVHPINYVPKGMNRFRATMRFPSKRGMKQFAENLRGRATSRRFEFLIVAAFFALTRIFSQPRPHLTNLRAKHRPAHLDRLSVRCLSSYLTFALIFGDKDASRFAGATRGAVCAPFLLPLPEIGKRHRG
jgi:hypothetical protein